MSNLAYELDDIYTYADYLSWGDEERYEIIDGIAYAMASPTVQHQRISRELMVFLHNFFKNKPCEVFSAPFDVRLFPKEDDSDTTVVQPDILVVCDSKKLQDGKFCLGAPDLIIEILSRNSAVMDRKVKAEKYQQAGVREYWIVNSDNLDVLVNQLTNDRYTSTIYKKIVNSFIFPDLTVDLKSIRTIIMP